MAQKIGDPVLTSSLPDGLPQSLPPASSALAATRRKGRLGIGDGTLPCSPLGTRLDPTASAEGSRAPARFDPQTAAPTIRERDGAVEHSRYLDEERGTPRGGSSPRQRRTWCL